MSGLEAEAEAEPEPEPEPELEPEPEPEGPIIPDADAGAACKEACGRRSSRGFEAKERKREN